MNGAKELCNGQGSFFGGILRFWAANGWRIVLFVFKFKIFVKNSSTKFERKCIN